MGRYNLLDEKWLKVINDKNDLEKVSLTEFFQNAHNYKRLSGESAPQDFAILRLLLAILHTTFSRFDVDGNQIDEDDEVYPSDIWLDIWEHEKFPMDAISEYLESQRDRFNLYDDEYPFYQVTKANLSEYGIKKVGSISGKLINRLISESNNKADLFAPTNDDFKNKLTDDSLARWLITFQGYTGTGDKAKFPGMKDSASKGWLLEIGGVYIQSTDLFHTLMLNLKMDDEEWIEQTPIWEWSTKDKMNSFKTNHPSNLADLYTNCSRLIEIDPDTDLSKEDVVINAVQLPKMDPSQITFEPMTLWQIPKSGNNKGNTIPKGHNENQSFWRSFGALVESPARNPDIINWFNGPTVAKIVSDENVRITAVGMSYNRDASSMPNDEIYDEINIRDEIMHAVGPEKWVGKISTEVENTKKSIYILKMFARDVMKIRNTPNSGLDDLIEEQAYFEVDSRFKEWIANITSDTESTAYSYAWRKELVDILIDISKSLMHPLNNRDLTGIENEKDKSMENIVTFYMIFIGTIKKRLGESTNE